MKHLLIVITLLLVPTVLSAQQWSSDPIVDSLKSSEAAILRFEAFEAYCHAHSHEKSCDGINDHIPTQFMNYDEAMELGKQQLEKDRQRREQSTPANLSLGELARRQRLQKQVEQAVRDFCTKNPDVKTCKEKTPAQFAKAFLTERDFKIEKQIVEKKP
jgi:hypothetical protein